MAYKGQRASKIGHPDIIRSTLVNEILSSFNKPNSAQTKKHKNLFKTIGKSKTKKLEDIFAVDGSYHTIPNSDGSEVGYVKTALVIIDEDEINEINKKEPHPLEIRDYLKDNQSNRSHILFHGGVFPLKNIILGNQYANESIYDVNRLLIYELFSDASLNGEIFKTFKWLIYEKWDNKGKNLNPFECPHCQKEAAVILKVDQNKGNCIKCQKEVLVTDMIGFHLDMSTDEAPGSILSEYMIIHEILLLFTFIRLTWEHDKQAFQNQIYIKDGPLSLRSQYSKLVIPIRNFFKYALKKHNINVHLVGQEKTGYMVEHLEYLRKIDRKNHPNKNINQEYFIPNNQYIRNNIQRRKVSGTNDYGSRTNYGSKIFYLPNNTHSLVLSIPTGDYKKDPKFNDFIGLESILNTITNLTSVKFPNSLYPIQLADNIASLSTYPSAKILSYFTDKKMGS